MAEISTVYVRLCDEGVDVWRPVTAESVGTGLRRLMGPMPPEETWQYPPGAVVRCEYRKLSGGRVLVAVGSVSG